MEELQSKAEKDLKVFREMVCDSNLLLYSTEIKTAICKNCLHVTTLFLCVYKCMHVHDTHLHECIGMYVHKWPQC